MMPVNCRVMQTSSYLSSARTQFVCAVKTGVRALVKCRCKSKTVDLAGRPTYYSTSRTPRGCNVCPVPSLLQQPSCLTFRELQLRRYSPLPRQEATLTSHRSAGYALASLPTCEESTFEGQTGESNGSALQKKWLVVVESPAKAGSIGAYLGPNYEVQASYGHVRDLATKAGSVQADEGFAMNWEVVSKALPRITALAATLTKGGASGLILATDPDREGEAIAWHVVQVLRDLGALQPDMEVQRVSFNEITRSAVVDAMAAPRMVSEALVDAYLARRALDYLVGYGLSPLLWRKVPGSRSAGRVQSVALRFLCEREALIDAFVPQEYWSVHAHLQVGGGSFSAALTHLDGQRLSAYQLADEAAAHLAKRLVEAAELTVSSVKRSQRRRNPAAPYTTSALQQDASLQLHFSATRTMLLAQELYEGVSLEGGHPIGLITYMRTDSVQIGKGAAEALREAVAARYGAKFVAEKPREFRTKAKNAQEAHEAIRPTDPMLFPEKVAAVLGRDAARLYGLIWARAMASQMETAVIDLVGVDVKSEDGKVLLHATGSQLLFAGYLVVFQGLEALWGRTEEGGGLADAPEAKTSLPPMEEGEAAKQSKVEAKQHHTQAPPRFSEGTLVKKMEEEGIGRPSTYAAIIRTLHTRHYIRLENRKLVPQLRGRVVAAFLQGFFPKYIDPVFTAEMEEQLDEVAGGRAQWREVLGQFWSSFNPAVLAAKEVAPEQVGAVVEDALGSVLFPPSAGDSSQSRQCPSCKVGRLGVKLTSHGDGLFLGCSLYPECSYIANVHSQGNAEGSLAQAPRVLGIDPDTGGEVTVRQGPYGVYIQLQLSGKTKPRRARLPKEVDAASVDLPAALQLLQPPPLLGAHADGGSVVLDHGPFGYYVQHGDTRASVPKGMNAAEITLEQAVELLETKIKRVASRRSRLKAPLDGDNTPPVAKKVTARTKSSADSVQAQNGALKSEGSSGAARKTTRGRKGPTDTSPAQGQAQEEVLEPGTLETVPEGSPEASAIPGQTRDKAFKTRAVESGRPKRPRKPEGPRKLSPEFSKFLGGVDEISRPMAIKRVWEYIKTNKLQDPADGRKARLDLRLQALLGAEETSYLGLAHLLQPHMQKKQ